MSEPYTGHNPIRYLLSEGKQFLSKHRDIVYPNSWETRREVKLWNIIGVQTSFRKGHRTWCETDTYLICQQCGEQFKCSPSRLNIKKFCSMKCYSESKKGKSFQNEGNFKQGHTPWNKGRTYKTKKS